MVSLSVEPWRVVVDANADELGQALADDLGPVRAQSVELTTGPAVLRAAIDSGERDRETTAWETTVRMSWLWAHDGLIADAPVALEVTIGTTTWSTDPEGMRSIDAGADRGSWSPTATGGRHLRLV